MRNRSFKTRLLGSVSIIALGTAYHYILKDHTAFMDAGISVADAS